MENGKQWFHSDVQGLRVLFESISLDEKNGFMKAYLLIITLCASERAMTYYLDHKLTNKTISSTGARILNIISRTLLYGFVTAFRLLYMLVIMYFNTGLFISVVASLTISQFFVEIAKSNYCNKTGPLAKVQNKLGYSDLPTMDQTLSAIAVDDDEDDEHEYTNRGPRHYNIPKIVISNEKNDYSTTIEDEGNRKD